jgi:hypothetical protein
MTDTDTDTETITVEKLPDVTWVETLTRVGKDWRPAVEIWFANETALRYVWRDDVGEIEEQTYAGGVVHDAFGLGGERDELAEYGLEALAEYLNVYRDDLEACKQDWPHIYDMLRL